MFYAVINSKNRAKQLALIEFAKNITEDLYFFTNHELEDEACEVFTSFEQVNIDTDGIGVMLYYGDSKASSEVQLKPLLLSHIITGLEVLQHKGNLLLKVKLDFNFVLGVRNFQCVHSRAALPALLVVR